MKKRLVGVEQTADLSTALRSGRDDKVVAVLELIFMEKGPIASHNFVISTGAQRSGEICGLLYTHQSWFSGLCTVLE